MRNVYCVHYVTYILHREGEDRLEVRRRKLETVDHAKVLKKTASLWQENFAICINIFAKQVLVRCVF